MMKNAFEFWILPSAHAEEGEAMTSLDSLGSSRPEWYPYTVTRAPWLMGVPAFIFGIVLIHLFRRERRRRIRRQQAEAYFND